MATQQASIDSLLETLVPLDIRARKMFGEYALYIGDKLVALVADEQLFVKPTVVGGTFLDESHLAPPYRGAKNCLLVPDAKWTDRVWLTTLLTATAEALPVPKPKAVKLGKAKSPRAKALK